MNQPTKAKIDLVTMHCPKCNRTKKAPRLGYEPKETARAVVSCPKCNPDGFEDISYFDASGKQLFVP